MVADHWFVALLKQYGPVIVILGIGLLYFYKKDLKNEQRRDLNDLRVQLQLDTVNRRLDICRDAYELILLNQLAENTEVLEDVKVIMKASLDALPAKYRPSQELTSLK